MGTTERSPVDVDVMRARFDATHLGSVGLEEEVLVLEPTTGHPSWSAEAVVRAADDARIKPELPGCQVELVTAPHRNARGALTELADLRRLLRSACASVGVVPAAAAVHPRVSGSVVAPRSDRHRSITSQFGEVARRQLVGSLQVHVGVGSAAGTLAVYNALRSHLPEIAAVAASAPLYEGRDTGLASVRPLVAGQLPRQGVPPRIENWDQLAADLSWGSISGTVPEPGRWWWELRPHVRYGTLEVRVADVQAEFRTAVAIAELVAAVVRMLAVRHQERQPMPVHPTWRIAENRWSALRDGVHGTLADLDTGETASTATRLHHLVDQAEDHAPSGLDGVRELIGTNGADRIRALGLRDSLTWIVDAFDPRPVRSSAVAGSR